MHELYTDIEINSVPPRVWQILTDLASFPGWNPYIRRASGELRAGARLRITTQPPGARALSFKPTVLTVEPERELRWLGRVGPPGLFAGEHAFIIEPLDAHRVRFIQRERFGGLLVPLVMHSLESRTRRGFEEMNRALKTKAEQVHDEPH